MQIWAESGKSALPICNYSQILYQFLTFTQNLKRSQPTCQGQVGFLIKTYFNVYFQYQCRDSKRSLGKKGYTK